MSEAAQLKHLEFLQGLITRQASNQFLMKGWALTVAAAFYGFAADKHNWLVAIVAIAATASFMWLDAYFLRQERLFRCLWSDAIDPKKDIGAFTMDTGAYLRDSRVRYACVLRSRPLLVFYALIMAVGIVVAVAAANHVGSPASKSHAARTRSATSSSIASGHGDPLGQIGPMRSVDKRGTT